MDELLLAPVHLRRRSVLETIIAVILIVLKVVALLAVVGVIHLLGSLLGFVLGPLFVEKVLALGLSELVGFEPSKTGDALLGEPVADLLACL